jgi:hypothetical protein
MPTDFEESKTTTIEPSKRVIIQKNVVTKYAFATRVGYMPHNPAKVN